MLKRNPKIPEGINHHNENPLKEFFQLLLGTALIVLIMIAVLGFLSGRLVAWMPFSWEKKLVETIDAELINVSLGDDSSCYSAEQIAAAELVLNRLVADLQTAIDLPQGMKITPHLLVSEQKNAFATLGGHIFISTGLFEVLSSENALAMVVAHEVGHVRERHPARSLGRGVMIQTGLAFLGLGSGGVASLVNSGGMLSMLSYSRDMERESDKIGMDTLERYYGHIAGADEFFKKMHEEHGRSAWEAMAQTHPATQERIEMINKRMKRAGKGELKPLPEAFQAFASNTNKKACDEQE